jgi:hypothetical protein
MLKTAAACLALLPAAALAEACPWLGADAASQVILAATPTVTYQKNPVFANTKGLVASSTCRFMESGELVGQLAVVVMEFGSYDAATAAYQKELKDQGARARPAKIGADPAFFTHDTGFSSASYAVKGKQLVFVNHVLGRRVKEAMQKDPDGAVLSTHDVARRVLEKL